jgi:Fe-S oxidoreductase
LDKIEDIEEQEEFGISKLSQFTWHDRLNFDACTECGRCTAACPVNRAGGELDPRNIIQSLKAKMNGDHNALVEPLTEGTVKKEALFACTACGACVEQCPSRIEIVSVINQMRRSTGMEEGEFAPNVTDALQNIQSVGNPWGLDPDERFDWGKDLDLPFAEPGKHYDILYWVGCSSSYDRRNQKIARAMIKILRASGLSFALMREESCNAELARRVGDEYLFQVQTESNIANLRQYTFSRILCHCPHCFNTLKNEYPQFENGNFNVISHVQFIAEQFSGGRFRGVNKEAIEVALHDPCYYARYNGIVKQPRDIFAKTPGVHAVNPQEWGAKTTCCGAGGGQFWTDTDAPERLNVIRLKAIVADTGVKTVCTSCPFCLSMMDSAKGADNSLKDVVVRDIAEIVAENIE